MVSEPERDQALAQHVFHRLAEAQVHAERQRRDQLSQRDLRAAGPPAHRPRLTQPGPGRLLPQAAAHRAPKPREDEVFASCAQASPLVTFAAQLPGLAAD
jgi:hypothetical protein